MALKFRDLILGWALLSSAVEPSLWADSTTYQLQNVWNGQGTPRDLKPWTVEEISKLNRIKSREKDPSTGKVVRWEGVLFSAWVEKALEALPLDQRAQVDLLVLTGSSGERAFLPRSLLSRFPLLLAPSSSGSVSVIVPWTSKPKILEEDLPLERYFIPQLARVEFTNYRNQYGSLFLKRRTDPSSIRGEKIFVQNCVNCHSLGSPLSVSDLASETRVRTISSNGHPVVKGVFRFDPRDRRAVASFLEAYRKENPSPPNPSGGSTGIIPPAHADHASVKN